MTIASAIQTNGEYDERDDRIGFSDAEGTGRQVEDRDLHRPAMGARGTLHSAARIRPSRRALKDPLGNLRGGVGSIKPLTLAQTARRIGLPADILADWAVRYGWDRPDCPSGVSRDARGRLQFDWEIFRRRLGNNFGRPVD